jgi:hypothetical protein
LVNRGYDVTLFASAANLQLLLKPAKLRDEVDGIQIRWIDNKSYSTVNGFGRIWSWIAFEWKLRKQLRVSELSNVYMIIVSSLSPLSILTGFYLKRKYNAKLVFKSGMFGH